MTFLKPLSAAIVAALLAGCAGSPLGDTPYQTRPSIAGTWEGNYSCATNSGFKPLKTNVRITFDPVGPYEPPISLVGVVQGALGAYKGEIPELKPLEHQKFTGTSHITLMPDDKKPYGGSLQFSGHTDTSGAFFITQARFFDRFGGDEANNLVAFNFNGVANYDGTLTARVCNTSMILRKVAG